MQKSARSTFSATAKDALLDEFKAIIHAGELTMRSDSSTIVHLDSHEVTRYTRAINRLNDRYGWHLDAQKTLSRLGKKLGKKCGGGWISPEKKCKSHYTDGKLNSSGKTSSADLADRIRSRKKMTAIRSRDGMMKNGQWDIGAAFAPGNEQQSSIRASRTGPNNNRTLNPDRAARMMAKEEARARVNWGKTTGDWKQKPDSTAAMDMVKPKAAASPTPIESGKSLKDLFSEADRIGAKYSGPSTMAERRIAKQEADRILQEAGYNEAVARASGAASMEKKRSEQSGTRKMNEKAPRSSAGDRIRSIAGRLKDEDNIQKFATGGIIKAAGKIYQNQNDLIEEVAAVANSDLDRKAARLARAAERKAIDNAPVRIPNQRRSNEPRKRGRSVD